MSNNTTLESGKEYTLSQLFSGDDSKIVIPDLQRDYCWGDKAWNKDKNNYTELVSGFVNNLLESFNDKSNKNLTLGLIYGYENPKYHIQLSDGQQRITTLFLLIGILNRKATNKFQKYLISEYELNKDDKEPYLQYAIRESTLYFLNDLVSEFFLKDKIISIENIKTQDWYFKEYDLDASIQSMIKAMKTIERLLDKKTDNLNYENFGKFLLENLQMIYYDMGNRIRGEETFVIINTTGEPLTATENLKPILIGNLEDEAREVASKEWEEQEEWFWQNRGSDLTSDNALNDFFVWYWQIRLLQERAWKNKKPYALNPRELFTNEPKVSEENEENPQVGRWEESIKTETIHSYFKALKKIIDGFSKNENISEVLNTIEKGEISLSWFRQLRSDDKLNVILPLITYLKKFKKPTRLYEFVRRIRKNIFDKRWEGRNGNVVDWRYIVQIIENSETEADVLVFETKKASNFSKIPNVPLNEWYNEEEKLKTELKKEDKDSIEKWEDYEDFMGDLTFFFDIEGFNRESISIEKIEYYYNNYVNIVDLIKNKYGEKDGETEKQKIQIVNLFRLFYLFIGCNEVGHMSRVTWEAEGVLFSTLNRTHLDNEEFKKFIASDNVIEFMTAFIKEKINEWDLLNLEKIKTVKTEFRTNKFIKLWLTLKVFNANKENVALSFYDGNATGVAAYIDQDKNKLIEEEAFSIENSICGYGVKAGGGGSYIHYTSQDMWIKPNIIDTPFAAVEFNSKERNEQQLEANRKKIEEIIEDINKWTPLQ